MTAPVHDERTEGRKYWGASDEYYGARLEFASRLANIRRLLAIRDSCVGPLDLRCLAEMPQLRVAKAEPLR